MYEKNDKRRVYWLIDLYLAGKIDDKTFCDEFYYSYDLEITASFPPESEFKSVEIWNSWLKEKGDFKFQYVLATPIERDLTPEEIAAYKALRTYGPTTVITNDAGAGMEVTYVADTKAYIDKKFKELDQAIVNTQIALL